MTKQLELFITAKVGGQIVFVGSGPTFRLPFSLTEEDRAQLRLFIEFISPEIAKAVQDSLPSLPENVEGQAQHLATARQWFNLIESGKQKARCSAWETEDGTRHILLVTKKP